MSKFGVEEFYDYAVGLLKDNIDQKITDINTEKGDALLVAPDSTQYFEDFTEQVLNKEFFIYHSPVSAEPKQSVGHVVSIEVTLHFYACFIDPNGGNSTLKRGMRYTRALAEIFQDGFASNSRVSDLEIIQHLPQSAQFEKQSEWYKIGGVEVKGTITT